MSISSFNMQTSSANSVSHMKRDSYVSYLIDYSDNAFEYKNYLDANEYLEYAKLQTKILTKRKMQSSAIENFVQEAVINIKENHTIKDIENLFKDLNNHFKGGFKLFDVAVHKDEGVFIESIHNVNDLTFDSKTLKIYKDNIDVTNDVISYAPNKDIFYNKETEKWYKEKTFENEFDTSKLQIKYNYHAHANFTKWEEATGKNIRLQKSDLQKIQDITAKSLQMQRGERNSKTKRMNHYQIKKLYADNNEIKKEQNKTVAKVKDLNFLTKQLRLELVEIKTNSEKEKAEKRDLIRNFEEKKRLLHSQIKQKELTTEQLQNEIQKLKEELLKKPKVEYVEIEKIKEVTKTIENPINRELQNELEKTKEYISTLENEKINSRQTIERLKNKNLSLQEETEQFQRKLDEQARKIKLLQNQSNSSENDLNSLKTQKNDLNNKIYELQEKINSRPNMSDYENILNRYEKLKEEKKENAKNIYNLDKEYFNQFKREDGITANIIMQKAVDLVKTLKDKLNAVMKRNKDLEQKVEELEAENKALQDDVKISNRLIELSKNDYDDLFKSTSDVNKNEILNSLQNQDLDLK